MSKDPASSPAPDERHTAGQNPGISNRESANEERAERAAHPPVDTSAPPPEDAAGRVGEQPIEGDTNLQTSHKAGSRSMAQKEAESRDPNRPISRWHVGQFQYLASKLDSMPEGDGTVLDNSCLMFLSSLFVGRTHDNNRLPVLLAGGLGGSLKTGRSLNYLGQPAENRKMCSLYLSLMDRMGVQLDHFGDADSRLARL